MDISARNQIKGTVVRVTPGSVMAEVEVDIGNARLVSVITKGSVDRLGLKVGDSVTAFIKSNEIMIGK